MLGQLGKEETEWTQSQWWSSFLLLFFSFLPYKNAHTRIILFSCLGEFKVFTVCSYWLFSAVRSGMGAAENHCYNLSGVCRRDSCKVTEDEIGGCRRRWKCCRMWWIQMPIPTPVIFSDYQEPLKGRLKWNTEKHPLKNSLQLALEHTY